MQKSPRPKVSKLGPKRGFYFPLPLLREFELFACSGMSYHVVGALLAWMALPADVRELAIDEALGKNPSMGVARVKQLIKKRAASSSLQAYLATLTDRQRGRLFAEIEKAGKK